MSDVWILYLDHENLKDALDCYATQELAEKARWEIMKEFSGSCSAKIHILKRTLFFENTDITSKNYKEDPPIKITVRRQCSNGTCKGEMIYTGESYVPNIHPEIFGTQYINRCNDCGRDKHLNSPYPTHRVVDKIEEWV